MIMGERVTETCFFLSDRKLRCLAPNSEKTYIISGSIYVCCTNTSKEVNMFQNCNPVCNKGSNLSVLTRDTISHQQTLNKQYLAGGWTNPFEKNMLVKMGSSSPIFEVKTTATYLSCQSPRYCWCRKAQLQHCSGMLTCLGMQSRPSLRSASWGSTTQRALWKTIPSRELTYPTWGSLENHLQKCHFWGIC